MGGRGPESQSGHPARDPQPGARPVPLRQNRAFQLLWFGSATAFLGLFEIEVAIPLVLLALTASPALTSLFATVQMTATVLLGVPAGALLDRFDRRAILIATELCRAFAMATVVVAQLLGHLTAVQLIALAAVIGGSQPFGTARILLVRTVIPREQVTAAVTAEEVRTNAAEMSGPPLGGWLVGLSHLLPFIVGGVAFLIASGLSFLLRTPRQTVSDTPRRNRMFSGLDVVLRNPTMRAAVALITLVNAIAWPARLTAIVEMQHRGTPSWEIGAALAGFALGGLLGTMLVKTLHRLLAPGVLLLAVGASQVVLLFALAAPWGPWWIGAACGGYGLGIPAIKVLIDILIVRQIPDAERGRALSGVLTLFSLAMPVAMACSGVLLQFLGPAKTLVFLASVLAAAIALAVSRRTVREARWPGDGIDADDGHPDLDAASGCRGSADASPSAGGKQHD